MLLLIVVAIFSWQAGVIPAQGRWQIALSALLLLVAVWLSRSLYQGQSTQVVQVSEQGDWQQLLVVDAQAMRITPASRVTGGLLWLALQPVLGSRGKKQWQLIFRDQVSEQDYRRLCRIIYLNGRIAPTN